MSTQRLNAAEKDLEKFIKFLALKSTQVVVQSRLGEKIQTQCNPLATGNDWFNIVVQDHPDICAETKRALALAPGDSILQRFPLCVEISLKTVEGDQMVLEVWSLDVQSPPHKDKGDDGDRSEAKENAAAAATQAPAPPATGNNTATNGATNPSANTSSEQQTLKAAHAIYNRMGVLLKSLITLTRSTPAYKLSRRQSPDSYGIYYRITACDRPQTHHLGDGHKTVRIGQLNTIVGTLSMSVAYRTKMTITPSTQAGRTAEGNTIMLDSNYFKPTEVNGGGGTASTAADGVSPSQQQKRGLNGVALNGGGGGGAVAGSAGGGETAGDRKVIDIEKPLRPGAFTDIGKLRQYTEEDFVLPETPPFEWLLRRTRYESGGSRGSLESLSRKCDSPLVASPPLHDLHHHFEPASHNNNNACMLNNNNTNAHNHNNNNVIAFKSLESDDTGKSPQSAALFVPMSAATARTRTSPPSSPPQSPATPNNSSSDSSLAPLDDDNLLKELNFPFASTTSHVNDLAKFYRDCYHAPPLKGLSELPDTAIGCAATATYAADSTTAAAAVDDLSRQLEQFETSLEDYDKLVSQLGLSVSSSTGSRSSGGLQMSN